ncbi:hypothetical protein WJX75_008121 [Coccomyxa subellipsoidea]|uniref:Bromo domain-containing protein n=1 Tax=Coccomyxa subellipsoidea TaxID=248742 RepID=A0ABR2YU27_9CHLO
MSEVDACELHFLILHYLSLGPCRQTAALLQEEALKHNLLPTRTDIFGRRHGLSYEELKERFSHVPQTWLEQLLAVLSHVRQRSGNASSQGLTSLLDAGALTSILALQDGKSEPAEEASHVARWLWPHHSVASVLQKNLLREIGWSPSVRAPGNLLPPEQFTKQLHYQRTVRGHHFAVYCIAFDRSGRRIITGSDDRLVKIWSVETALLLLSCRGHEGEVTDLALSSDNGIVASSSNDTTIRCWDMTEGQLGVPVAVLLGHTAPVTFIDFCACIPDALLSSSLDGTCRIWSAKDGGAAVHVLTAAAIFGPTRGLTRFGGGLPGDFGRHTRSAAGPSTGPASGAAGPSASNGRASAAPAGPGPSSMRLAAAAAAAAASNGSAPASGDELQQGAPSQNETPGLLVCSFSNDANYIVAGANDCCTYVWHWDVGQKARHRSMRRFYAPPEDDDDKSSAEDSLNHNSKGIATGAKDGSVRIWRRQRKGRPVSNMWVQSHALSCPVDDAAAANARRRRRAPPTNSINQVAWTRDDSMILAALTDDSVRVWDAWSGQLLQRLEGHAGRAHVLECHPLDHRLAMSAGYDGLTIIWDIIAGRALTRFSTQDTRPAGDRWCDPIQLVDGHWSADGASVVVADVAGQWHLYSCGNFTFPARALYDHFLSGDYTALVRDASQFVLDADSQQPPHISQQNDTLVDFLGEPYPPSIQAARREGRLGRMFEAELAVELRSQPGMLPNALIQAGPTLTAAAWQSQEAGGSEEDIQLAVARAHERMLQAELAESQAPAAQAGPSEPQQQQPARGGRPPPDGSRAASSRQAEQVRALNRLEDDADSLNDFAFTSDEESEGWQHTEARPTRASVRQQARQLRSRNRGAGEAGDHEESEDNRERRAARRAEMRERRQVELMLEESAARPTRASKRPRRGAAGASAAEAGTSGSEFSSGEDEYEVSEDGVPGTRRLLRKRTGAAPGGSQRQRERERERERQESRRRQREARLQKRNRSRLRAQAVHAEGAALEGRSIKAYSWLQVLAQTPGVYVPQLGDDVVYLQQGHRLYFEKMNDKRRGPWDTVISNAAGSRGCRMRQAEPARVVALRYEVSADAHHDTMAVLRLALADEASPLAGREFEVEMPPPHHGQAEFIVLRSRFDASVQRDWHVGDKCQVYYPDEEPGRGQWWAGQVVVDQQSFLEPEEARQLLENPWGSESLWERFTIHWDEPVGADPSQQSPWEMFNEDVQPEEVLAEAPALEPSLQLRASAALERLSRAPRFQLFHETPTPDAVFSTGDEDTPVWYTAVVPLPLAIPDLLERVRSGYYRQPQALQHDARTIASNAVLFNGDGSEVALLADELAGCIIAAVQGQEVVINEATGVDDDEDEEEVDISEDSEDEGGAGFHHFERRPRSQRKRINHSAPGALGPSSDDEDEEEAGPSRHTRHRSSHRNAGAHGHAEGSAGALGGNSRFPSRLRHVVSRYSPEADGAAFPDRHARRRDGDAQHSAPSQGQAAPSRRRSQEHPAAGPSGRGEPAPASAAPGRFSAPVVRLRVSSRLHGLETPPIAQLLRSHPPSLPPPAAAVDGAGRPPRRAAAAAVQPLLPSPGASPEPEQRRRASLRGNMREQSTPALQNGAADSAGPAASVEDGAPRSQEPSPGRPTRRRAASMTPSLPCAGANGTAHSNGDAAAVGGGRWPRRQGSRTSSGLRIRFTRNEMSP